MIRLIAQSAEQARSIYDHEMQRDFPAAEIKPWEVGEALFQKGCYEFLTAYDDARFVGYAWVYAPKQGAVLLDYFAVLPPFRGTGMGSQILRALMARYEILILESEHPDTAPDPEIAQRRLAFYARNGMMNTGLRVLLFGVDFSILSSKPIDARQEMDAIYRGLLGEELREKAVVFL